MASDLYRRHKFRAPRSWLRVGQDDPVSKPRLTVFVHLTATPAWLALTRPERQEVIHEHIEPLLRRHDAVNVRWFDAEAWSAAPSDVLVAETDDITAWSDMFEELRDTPLWSVPYFLVERIIPAVEDAFVDYEQRTGHRPAAG